MKRFHHMTEPQIAAVMQDAGRAAARALPRGTLFVLLAFDQPGAAQYLSNARREETVRALREAADRIEGRQAVPRVEFLSPPIPDRPT